LLKVKHSVGVWLLAMPITDSGRLWSFLQSGCRFSKFFQTGVVRSAETRHVGFGQGSRWLLSLGSSSLIFTVIGDENGENSATRRQGP
jgi:hypothetical protein